MPFFGLLSFLPKLLFRIRRQRRLCQCPSSGFSHFYLADPQRRDECLDVSMPFFGLLSFLRTQNRWIAQSSYVSMPFFGLLSFLLRSRTICRQLFGGVNALLRASLISTGRWHFVVIPVRCVSMPFFGLLSFLHQKTQDQRCSQFCVSMPFFELLSFLQYPPEPLCL